MAYTVTSSERTTGSGNENETKALLHLMSFASNCDEMDSFIVDFFNDVTGSDPFASKLWDVQSKKKKSGPKEIGTELVTLYKNFICDMSSVFVQRILFLGGVTETVRLDNDKKVFLFSEMKDVAKTKVREGLVEECVAKTYIPNHQIEDTTIDAFLKEVIFVEAEQGKANYIRPLVRVSPALMPSDRQLEAIFNEIRDKQSVKKNRPVEGITISLPDEVFELCRHLKRLEIEQLILSRIVNGDPFKGAMPRSFVDIALSLPPEEEREKIEDCKLGISRQMFDKNSTIAFWRLFEAISVPLLGNSQLSINDVYAAIDQSVLNGCVHLDPLSTKYFIAVIKDGLQ